MGAQWLCVGCCDSRESRVVVMAILADEWTEVQEVLYDAIVDSFESEIASGDTEFHFWLVDIVAEKLSEVLVHDGTTLTEKQKTNWQNFSQLILNRQFGGPDVVGSFSKERARGV